MNHTTRFASTAFLVTLGLLPALATAGLGPPGGSPTDEGRRADALAQSGATGGGKAGAGSKGSEAPQVPTATPPTGAGSTTGADGGLLSDYPAWHLSELVEKTLASHTSDALRLQADQQAAIRKIAQQTSDQAEEVIKALSKSDPDSVQRALKSLTSGSDGAAQIDPVKLEAGNIKAMEDLQREVIADLQRKLDAQAGNGGGRSASSSGTRSGKSGTSGGTGGQSGQSPAADDPASKILAQLTEVQRKALMDAIKAGQGTPGGSGKSSSGGDSSSNWSSSSDSASDSASDSSSSSDSSQDSQRDSQSSSSSDSKRSSQSSSSKDGQRSGQSSGNSSSAGSRDRNGSRDGASNGSRSGSRDGSRDGSRGRSGSGSGSTKTNPGSRDAQVRDVLRQVPPAKRPQVVGGSSR